MHRMTNDRKPSRHYLERFEHSIDVCQKALAAARELVAAPGIRELGERKLSE